MPEFMNKEKQDVETSEELLNKTQDALAKVNFNDDADDSTPESESDTKQTETKDGDSTSVDDSGQADKSDDSNKEGGEETTEEPLPDNYFRAAIHQGWTPEEIQEFYSSNPNAAKKTFEKIYESTNFITNQTAELGRKGKQLNDKLSAAEKPVVKASEFQEINLEDVKKRYPDVDDPVIELIGQISKQNKLLHDKISSIESTRAPAKEISDVDKVAENAITEFFGDNALEKFVEFYGAVKTNDNWGHVLTGQQLKNRLSVVELADQVLAGAQLQGREMDYDEALHLAHLSVSHKVLEKVVRDDLKTQIKQRSKGITVKSTGGAKTSEDSQPASEQKLQTKVASLLGKIYPKK